MQDLCGADRIDHDPEAQPLIKKAKGKLDARLARQREREKRQDETNRLRSEAYKQWEQVSEFPNSAVTVACGFGNGLGVCFEDIGWIFTVLCVWCNDVCL